MYTQPNSRAVSKGPCPSCRKVGRDQRGDNLVTYDDGHTYCFSCGYYENDAQVHKDPVVVPIRKVHMSEVFSAIKDRNISERIASKFNVSVVKGKDGTISKHEYPYYSKDGKHVIGKKVRQVSSKTFYSEGDLKSATLFGQQLWRDGGKYVTVVEGELDALAVSEMFDGKWPVVSLKTGAAGAVKDIKENLEWLESFENVIICFDNDDPGNKATQEVLPLFSHGKVKAVSLPLKDACDMLKNGRVKDFVSAWWEAKPYRPVDVLSFSDERVWDAFVKRGTEEIIPLPEAYGALNAMMNGGIAAGEITVIGALTSVGKTTMVNNLLYDMVKQGSKKIGAVFLEADVGEIAEKIISLECGENISVVPQEKRDNSLYRQYYDNFKANDNVYLLEHLGMSDVDELFSKMRWMVKGMDCDVLIIDPLHAAVRSDENGTVDEFMDRCLKLAKETGVAIIIISHMRKPNVKDPHDVNEYDMKGSGSINQIAFNTILLSRDKMSEDDYTRNSTLVQLVKCRRTGRTGQAGWLYYEDFSGRMVAGSPPELKAVENENF